MFPDGGVPTYPTRSGPSIPDTSRPAEEFLDSVHDTRPHAAFVAARGANGRNLRATIPRNEHLRAAHPHHPVLLGARFDRWAGVQADVEAAPATGGQLRPIATSLTVQDTHDVKALAPVTPGRASRLHRSPHTGKPT